MAGNKSNKEKETIKKAGNEKNKPGNIDSLIRTVFTKVSQIPSTFTKKVSDFSNTSWRWPGTAPPSASSSINASTETTKGTQQPGPSPKRYDDIVSESTSSYISDREETKKTTGTQQPGPSRKRYGDTTLQPSSGKKDKSKGGNNNH